MARNHALKSVDCGASSGFRMGAVQVSGHALYFAIYFDRPAECFGPRARRSPCRRADAATAGIGFMITVAGATFQTDKVFVGVLIFAVAGLIGTELIGKIETLRTLAAASRCVISAIGLAWHSRLS